MGRGLLAFVGRERELAELEGAVAAARAGRGGIWLLSGEPGIGKSRLLEEITGAASDATVLWGRAWEVGGAPAYWPWTQVLRAALRELGELEPARRAALAPVVPELRHHVAAPVPPEQARFEVLDAVSATLADLAARRPVLIVLEDLHAADASSLALLHALAGSTRGARIAVLGTFRDVAAARGEAAALLARIAQDARTIAVPRLTADEVAAYLGGALAADRELVATVYRRTGGNPLFVVELARLLAADGEADARRAEVVPPSIRTTIGQRVEALDDEARGVLALAAVVGREVLAGQLAEAFGRDAAAVRRALDRAEAVSLVASSGPGAYRFTHILVQEVIHDGMPEDERRAGHLALARALSRRHGDGADAPWSEIAHHLAAAAAPRDDVLAAVGRAAAQAAAAHAFEDAAEAYARGLELIDRGEDDRRARARMLVGLGEALLRAGRVAEGRARCRAAFTLARELGDRELLGRAALAAGAVMVFGAVDAALIALLEDAVAAQGEEDSPMRARLLARLAAAMQPAADPRVPIRIGHEAIAMARRLGDPAVLLDALRAGGAAMVDLEDPAVRRPLHEEHAALAEAAGDRAEALLARLRLVFVCFELGDREGAHAAIAAVARHAAAVGHASLTWRTRALDATRALWEGRFAEAAAAIADVRAAAARCGDPNVGATIAYQELRLARLAGREDEIVAAAARVGSLFRGTRSSELMMDVIAAAELAAIGRVAEARAGAASARAALATGDRTLLEPIAELALATGDRGLAAAVEARLDPEPERFVVTGVVGMTWNGPLARARALVRLAQGDAAGAVAAFAQAIDEAAARGGEPLVATIAAEAAEVARAIGDERAAAWRARADEIATRLGMARIAAAAPAPAPSSSGAFSIARDGDGWRVEHAGRAFRLKDTRGLHLLARLCAAPGVELSALDLETGELVDAGDAGEVLDPKARAAYAARARELEATLAEAEAWNDAGRAEAARAELDALAGELARAVGLGGRTRRAGSVIERARVNVTRRLRDAIRRIEEHDPALGRHLARAVRTGTFCRYDP